MVEQKERQKRTYSRTAYSFLSQSAYFCADAEKRAFTVLVLRHQFCRFSLVSILIDYSSAFARLVAKNPIKIQQAKPPIAIPAITPIPKPSSSPFALTRMLFSSISDGMIVAKLLGDVGLGVITICGSLTVGDGVLTSMTGALGVGATVGNKVGATVDGDDVGDSLSGISRFGGSGHISTVQKSKSEENDIIQR